MSVQASCFIRQHLSRANRLCRILSSDSDWFQRHPSRLLCFRPLASVERLELFRLGHAFPALVPPGFPSDMPLSWVVVADLYRILGLESVAAMRCRIATVPIRSRSLQVSLTPFYVDTILDDFMTHHCPQDFSDCHNPALHLFSSRSA